MALAAVLLAAALNCTDAGAVNMAWKSVAEAYAAADRETTKQRSEAMIRACPRMGFRAPWILRADVAAAEGDYAGALHLISGIERPGKDSLGRMTSMIALASYAGLGDGVAHAREREKLVMAISARMTDRGGRVKARRVEQFTVGDMTVTAFEGDYTTGSLLRHATFIVEPAQPLAPLRTITLTTNLQMAKLDPRKVFILDEYECNRHATLDMMLDQKPTYAELKAKVSEHLASPTGGLSSGEHRGTACAFAGYLAPGFE